MAKKHMKHERSDRFDEKELMELNEQEIKEDVWPEKSQTRFGELENTNEGTMLEMQRRTSMSPEEDEEVSDFTYVEEETIDDMDDSDY